LDPDPTYNVIKKSFKKSKMRGHLFRNKLLLTLKRQDFVQFFVFGKLLNIVWIRSRSQNRNHNQNFSKIGTGTATNHYGYTTLTPKDEVFFFAWELDAMNSFLMLIVDEY
jgi:hypothetical protein